ncbi:hypothetical protein DPMN_107311 [Dreissena polymorpha]|uniref:Uncharacterized protein n=1 Tax=Dreissena polymorpha TaxID=45954 RepID=A0A9D4K6I5_DREPO|nr:hypothetical protein DPMN_107311 [Dreissena polymorpha]
MGNSSGTNVRKDCDVIAAIFDEKNKWHEILSGAKHPDMVLINDLLFNTHQRLKCYVKQMHSTSVEIQTDLDERTIELEEQLEKLKTDRDALTIRLSKVVGEKLMKDNSYITDLSDENRPTKIGEVYTKLYDNEWTDAYEALTKS